MAIFFVPLVFYLFCPLDSVYWTSSLYSGVPGTVRCWIKCWHCCIRTWPPTSDSGFEGTKQAAFKCMLFKKCLSILFVPVYHSFVSLLCWCYSWSRSSCHPPIDHGWNPNATLPISRRNLRMNPYNSLRMTRKHFLVVDSVIIKYKASGYTVYLTVNSILKIRLHLQMLYSQLKDQQVAPLT